MIDHMESSTDSVSPPELLNASLCSPASGKKDKNQELKEVKPSAVSIHVYSPSMGVM